MNMKIKYWLLMWVTIFLPLAILIGLTPGCSTSQVATAYKASVVTDTTVRASLAGWNIYVGAKHPGTNAELQVLTSFKRVKQAELTIVDAEAALALNPTNTAPLIAAETVFQATQADLVALIGSLTNSIK